MADESADAEALWREGEAVFDQVRGWYNGLEPGEQERSSASWLNGAMISTLKVAQSKAHVFRARARRIPEDQGGEAVQRHLVAREEEGFAACARVADLHLARLREVLDSGE
jgi:hypothetical protein